LLGLGVLVLVAAVVFGALVARSWTSAKHDENAQEACALQGDHQGFTVDAVKNGSTHFGYMCAYRKGEGRTTSIREPLRSKP
jgi:hypothetical protein